MKVETEDPMLDVTVTAVRGREGSVKVLIMSWRKNPSRHPVGSIVELDWSEFFGWRLLEKVTGNSLPVDVSTLLEEKGLQALGPYLEDPRAFLLSFEVMES